MSHHSATSDFSLHEKFQRPMLAICRPFPTDPGVPRVPWTGHKPVAPGWFACASPLWNHVHVRERVGTFFTNSRQHRGSPRHRLDVATSRSEARVLWYRTEEALGWKLTDRLFDLFLQQRATEPLAVFTALRHLRGLNLDALFLEETNVIAGP